MYFQEKSSGVNEDAQTTGTNSLPPIKSPRAKWLVWISVFFASYMFLLTSSIEGVSQSVLVITLIMSVSLAIAIIPLLIYVAINGLSALRFVKTSLGLLALIILFRVALELVAIAGIMRFGTR